MVLQVLCWFGVVVCVSSKVVHQADGIVSIITELEPDRTPVAYLQAVDSPGRAPSLRPPERVSNNLHQGIKRPSETARDRRVPYVVQAEDIPLEEGQFRVKSAEIRLVNPDTRSVQQAPPQVEEKNQEQVTSNQENEHSNDPKGESASDSKVVHPLKNSEDDETTRESRYRGDFLPKRDYERQRKEGSYGHQTPRGDDVRNDPDTRIRDDDFPTKFYKPGIDRPPRRGDEFVTSRRKSGKAGHYVTYPPPSRPSYRKQSGTDRDRDTGLRDLKRDDRDRDAGLRDLKRDDRDGGAGFRDLKRDDLRRDDLRIDNNNRQIKTEKDYSSKPVLKYPNGQAREKERRGESSSKFKIGNTENKKFSNPTDSRKNDRFGGRRPFNNDKIESDELHGASSFIDSSIENDDGFFEYRYSGKDFYGRNGFGDYGKIGLVGVGGVYGRANYFERSGGNDYLTESEFVRGAKGGEGHHDEGSYLNEQSNKHSHGKNKRFAEEKGSDHLDQSFHYTTGRQDSLGSKGEDFHKNNGHRKGHKKSGFHSAVHEDEFNKKVEVYDEERSSGEDKHRDHKSGQHFDKAGGKGKKEHLDSVHSGHYGHEDEHKKRFGH